MNIFIMIDYWLLKNINNLKISFIILIFILAILIFWELKERNLKSRSRAHFLEEEIKSKDSDLKENSKIDKEKIIPKVEEYPLVKEESKAIKRDDKIKILEAFEKKEDLKSIKNLETETSEDPWKNLIKKTVVPIEEKRKALSLDFSPNEESVDIQADKKEIISEISQKEDIESIKTLKTQLSEDIQKNLIKKIAASPGEEKRKTLSLDFKEGNLDDPEG